ncbi:hypothetical protein LDENG_00290510 [Lucifuga dentata]|nr:hypothetical protein LDENG_00290510 [Lucifuga dentata]
MKKLQSQHIERFIIDIVLHVWHKILFLYSFPQFSDLKILEPVDTQTALINAREAEAVSAAALRHQCLWKHTLFFLPQLDKLRNMIPFDQMTIEDLNETFQETKLDKYWPHKPIADL